MRQIILLFSAIYLIVSLMGVAVSKDDGDVIDKLSNFKASHAEFDWIQEHFETKPDGIIYLRAEPETSYERIKKRSRDEESIIPLDYFKQIHEKHENWLQNENNVLILDANVEFENNMKHKNFIFSNGIDMIHEFFNIERKTNSKFLSKSVQFIGNNSKLNKFFSKVADEGALF